jgi:hypothetical protein
MDIKVSYTEEPDGTRHSGSPPQNSFALKMQLGRPPGKEISLYPDKHIFVYIYSGRIVAASEGTTLKEREEILCSHE